MMAFVGQDGMRMSAIEDVTRDVLRCSYFRTRKAAEATKEHLCIASVPNEATGG